MNPDNKQVTKSVYRYLEKREIDLHEELRSVLRLKMQLEVLPEMELIESTQAPAKNPIEESEMKIKWEQEVIKIMKQRKKPMTKVMLIEALSKKFVFYRSTAMLKLSSLFMAKKNKNFKTVKKGWYALNI